VTGKSVESYLNNVSYEIDENYVPTDFSLEFINFIKLVNGDRGEENKTPVLHYKMLDQLPTTRKNILNMLFRGSAKTSLMAEYLFLYIGLYGSIPGFGKIPLALYVSDSIENGVKNMRKNLEHRWENSSFLKEYIPTIKFTDIRWEFKNKEGSTFIVKGYGAMALSLDSVLFTPEDKTTIGECRVGDKIYGADGKLATIINKSEIFNKPMYCLKLKDGRSIKVSEDHINSVVINTDPDNIVRWEDKNLTTKELLNIPLTHTRIDNKNHSGKPTKSIVYVRNCLPLEYEKKEFTIDPYTLGLILGDDSVKKNDNSTVITGLEEDFAEYKKSIPHKLGEPYLDKKTESVLTWAVKGINQEIRDLGLVKHGEDKSIPEIYFYGSIKQRMELLRGLLDTGGIIYGSGRISFYSNSPKLCEDVSSLVRSLGGKAHIKYQTYNKEQFTTLEIWINECPFNLSRKAKRFIKDRQHWDKSAVISISRIQDEPSQCIAIDNDSKQFITEDYFRTHNTGVRGSKEMGVRPTLAVLDDLVSDDDAKSPTVIAKIEDTVYKAIDYALHPTKNKIIWNGTPFNSKDPLYKAVESGAWYTSVYPVCEKFPCSKEEFRGAWSDRFPYEYVKEKYDKAVKAGKIDTFNQEMMLRIMSAEDRLIQDSDIQWYSVAAVRRNMTAFNFYITTDFATSEATYSDFSVISVWAINSNGDWFWVDGIVKRQLMDANIDDLFRFAQKYKPQSVGVEISGQQKGFISWIQKEMLSRNIYFTLASDQNSNVLGIRPVTNKMQRFNVVLPWFKLKKIFFPEELKKTAEMMEAIDELSLAASKGFRSKHDDFIDTISMLGSLTVWKPSDDSGSQLKRSDGLWDIEKEDEPDTLASYIV